MLYIDILIQRFRKAGYGCNLYGEFFGCLLFADDIMIISHSVSALQRMLQICSEFAEDFNIKHNSKKSVAMRI